VAKIIPVISCITKVRPNKEPKFQNPVIFEGEGKSTIVELTIDKRG
jgi:hypothetical protein